MHQETHNEELPVPLTSPPPSPRSSAVAPLSIPERSYVSGIDSGASVLPKVKARRRKGNSPNVRAARALLVLVLSDVLWELVRRYAVQKCGNWCPYRLLVGASLCSPHYPRLLIGG